MKVSLNNTLALWISFQNKSFVRKSFIDIDSNTINCDCSGFINLLFKQLNFSLPYQIDRPKAVHYFSVLQEIGSNKINDLDKGHLLAWRKETLPKSGDTGHVLVANGKPIRLTDDHYCLNIIDSTKKQNGLSQRDIELQTNKKGEIIGVRWHLDEHKVKRTAIYHQSLAKCRYCFGCGLPKNICGCHTIKPLLDTPPIIIFRHPTERKKTLSTVSLIKQRYPNVLVKEGEVFSRLRTPNIGLLFPSEDKITKTSPDSETECPSDYDKNKTLILIDGTWKKAKKILHLNPWLQTLERTTLEPSQTSHYLIRKIPDSSSLSSVESFATALKDEALLELFTHFVNKQINIMGNSTYQKNYSHYINFSD